MNDFSNAVILVTGAASGIGAALATRLAGGGARKLILFDRDEDRLRDFAFSLPCERQILIGDVADADLWASADLTGLSHAAINAGTASGSSIVETDYAEWRRVMSVNLDGAFLSLQAAMKAIRAGGAGGAIVLTASASGIRAEPGVGAYAASKAAIIQLARVAAKEGAPDRIRVNSIAPGGVETPIWSDVPFFQDMVAKAGSEADAFTEMGSLATPLGRFAKAEEIAEQIAFLMSEKTGFVTGSCLVSDGGYTL